MGILIVSVVLLLMGLIFTRKFIHEQGNVWVNGFLGPVLFCIACTSLVAIASVGLDKKEGAEEFYNEYATAEYLIKKNNNCIGHVSEETLERMVKNVNDKIYRHNNVYKGFWLGLYRNEEIATAKPLEYHCK